jgi:AraC-like DNA-binding protein
MVSNSDLMIFRDRLAFFEALSEAGKSVEDASVTCAVTSFADVRIEKHLLFDCVELNIFEVFPKTNLQISYDFDGEYVEIEYGVSGLFSIFKQEGCRALLQPNGLFLSSRRPSLGKVIFHKRQPCKNISFHATDGLIKALLGKSGCDLGDEVMGYGDASRLGNLFSGAPASPDIANCFIQVANCAYPERAKRLFFESKFREILSLVIAHGLPAEEKCPGAASFAADQVRKIPAMLMERCQAPPAISNLARELSMNATTMKRQFKEMFGVPIYSHHRSMCMERAAVMLSETDVPVFEIAIDAGYSSGENFCHAFKRHYGVSPRQFRRDSRL